MPGPPRHRHPMLRHASLRLRCKLALLRASFAVGSRLAPARTTERAARLLCTPYASSRVRARAASAASGIRHEWLEVDGQRLASYRWGDPATQPYVLLVHGWSSFALRFLPWVEALREAGYAVLAFDQPGHGHSEGGRCSLPDFARMIECVGERHGEAAWAIAHSLGAAALVLAQGERWRARGLILLAPAADPVAATRRFSQLIGLGAHLQPQLHARLQAQTGISIHDLRVTERLAALSQPALIVHDRDDHEVPASEGMLCARLWPGARFFETAGLGHHDVLGAATVVAQGLAFIGETSAPPTPA